VMTALRLDDSARQVEDMTGRTFMRSDPGGLSTPLMKLGKRRYK
jgi:hypothetical protein